MKLENILTTIQTELLDYIVKELSLSVPEDSINQSEAFLRKSLFLPTTYSANDLQLVLNYLEGLKSIQKQSGRETYTIDTSEGIIQVDLEVSSYLGHQYQSYSNARLLSTEELETEMLKRYMIISNLAKYSPLKKSDIHKYINFKEGFFENDSLEDLINELPSDLSDLEAQKILHFEDDGELINIYYYPISLARLELNISTQLRRRISDTSSPQKIKHQITWTKDRRILLDGTHEIGKPNFMQENDLVFDFLFNNPNKPWTREEIKAESKISVGKSFDKIIENLGFKGDIRKAFFNISKTHIQFNNPVTERDLLELGIDELRY